MTTVNLPSWVIKFLKGTDDLSAIGNDSHVTEISALQLLICVSIDRFLQNRAPNGCLPFDRIGARHPGIPVVTTSAHIDFSGLSTRSLAHTSAYKVTNDLGSAVIASSGFLGTAFTRMGPLRYWIRHPGASAMMAAPHADFDESSTWFTRPYLSLQSQD